MKAIVSLNYSVYSTNIMLEAFLCNLEQIFFLMRVFNLLLDTITVIIFYFINNNLWDAIQI